MAIRPDWMTGTLNLVAGTPDFTTTGSALQTAAIQAGDAIITATGYVLIIAEITGQNSGRLFDNCPVAAAGAGQPLRVRYQPDGSRVQAAVRMMRDLLTTGNLEAFAALVGEEDAVPVFVGPGVMKLVPKSEFGPDDTKGNLATLAVLENITNLTELAEIAKANDQFIIMGADGTITLKSIKSVTDAIAEKYELPADGAADQLLDATGAAISKESLPISTAAQNALSGKADAVATQSALNNKANLSGATFTGLVSVKGDVPTIDLVSGNGANRWRIIGNITDTVDYGVVFQNARTGVNLVEIGAAGRALITYGDVYINGSISKGGGTFLIDHPLDPANRNLRHGFVEAPRYELIYRGSIKLVNGRASVNIDSASDMTSGTFTALTKNACVTSLQNQDGFTRLHPSPIVQGAFEIICDDEICADTVSWVVIAERNDAYVRYLDPNCERGTGRFIPEFDKED